MISIQYDVLQLYINEFDQKRGFRLKKLGRRASMLLRFVVCFAPLVAVFDCFCRCTIYFGLSEVSHRYLRMDDMLVSGTRRKCSPK